MLAKSNFPKLNLLHCYGAHFFWQLLRDYLNRCEYFAIHVLMHLCAASDREGIALAKCISEDAPEMASRSQFLSCYQSVADQASKMGIGETWF